MLKVGIVDKVYNGRGEFKTLVGYVIRTRDGAEKAVDKKELVQRVREGSVSVVNRTLSSDDRFIGKSELRDSMFEDGKSISELRNAYLAGQLGTDVIQHASVQQVKKSRPVCRELYTCEKGIVGMLCENDGFDTLFNTIDTLRMISNGEVDGVTMDGKKISVGDGAKRKNFKQVLKKYIDSYKGAEVTKDGKFYVADLGCEGLLKKDAVARQMVATYALISAKDKVKDIDESGRLIIDTVSKIGELRKTLKNIPV